MSAQALPHTRALLAFLFATYSKRPTTTAVSSSSSPPPPSASASASASSTSSAGPSQPPSPELSLKSLSIAGSSSGGSRSGGSDDEALAGRGSDSVGAHVQKSNIQKIELVERLLSDPTIDEDDMPERIQETLADLLVSDVPNLDGLVLSLLHRHREDVHPSGNAVPPLPNHGTSTPTRPSVSRSSSIRRTYGGPPLARGGSNLRSDSSAQPSDMSSASSSNLSPRSAHATPSHSPWSSPRPAATQLALNAGASEFKFSAGANDFVPGGGGPASTLHAPGTASPGGSLLGSRPGTPLRSRSPHPTMNPVQAQANWAFTASPLGTPKYAVPPAVHSGTSSPAPASPGYFPRSLGAGVAERLQQQQWQARQPWAEAGDSSTEGSDKLPFAEDEDDDNPEPTDYKTRRPNAATGHQLETESPHHWPAGDPGVYQAHHTPSYPRSGAFTPNGGPDPAWREQNQPQDGHLPPGPSGLGGMGAYAPTPFDRLYAIFAGPGSHIDPALLEEALAMSGFDVDAAIEYILQGGNPPTPGQEPPSSGAEGEREPAPISNRSTLLSSGSRPMVVSRDSFDGFVSNGGRGSPAPGGRWGGGPQRSSTPSGPDGARGGAVGGRVCRYYLSGNCLRSDCKFSHDVGKAVCKFWLRGHCLKGDGRCDFLHSIPPVLRANLEERSRRRAQSPAGAS